MSEKLTGVCIIQVDGKSIRSKDKAELEFGGYIRTPVHADGKLVGYTEKPVEAKVSATIAHGSSTRMAALRDTKNASIVFQTDTGVRYLITGAFATRPPKLTGGEGDCSVEYAGDPATEL